MEAKRQGKDNQSAERNQYAAKLCFRKEGEIKTLHQETEAEKEFASNTPALQNTLMERLQAKLKRYKGVLDTT